MRRDVNGVSSGEPCGVFVEVVPGSTNQFQANYPVDQTGQQNCDVAAMLASRVVNRGALNVFNNATPSPKNIERLDYLFDNGVLAPVEAASLAQAGHLVAEKNGNNPIKVAAVLELDVFGQPARYGEMVTINGVDHTCVDAQICYGLTDLQHDYAWLESESLAPQSFPVLVASSAEPVAMAFVSAEALGLSAGQRYFGFSFFPDDVDAAEHDLLDVTTFPADTEDAYILKGDDADIYGGVSGYFVGEGASVASGDVFKDENGDGIRDDNEAGLSGVELTLYEDSDGNGVLDPATDGVVVEIDSATDGSFTLPAVPDGNFFLQLDAADEDIPDGLIPLEGGNPLPFVVSGGSPDGLAFVFIDDDSNMPGDGSTDSGMATAGGDDTGESTSGSATAGGDDSGESTAGTATAGGDDTGESTAGTATAGGDDSGESTAGAATAGGDDTGESTAGTATAGGDDSDVGDTDDASGGGDSGTGGETDPVAGEDDPVQFDAVQDFVELNQDTPTTIDVLANDVDPTDNGLTLVSVEQPANGTAEVVDGQVLYTPGYGFIGEDPFMYTVMDGGNTVANGTVSTTVVRYSDLNRDDINDFDQCGGCDSLSLETGLDGSGVGRLMPLTLLMLFSLVGFRAWLVRRPITAGDQR